MKTIGMIESTEPDQHQQAFLKEKRREFESRQPVETDDDYPSSAILCKKCQTRAVVNLDNCLTCLNCGESKCS